MRATLVHNPDAGAGRPSPKKLMALLKDAGFTPIYCHAKQDDLDAVIAEASGLVIAAGGDGTVTRVATRLPKKVPMTILPLGTANNLAKVFGVSGTVESLIEGLGEAAERRLDVCVASGPWGEKRFVEAVGIGALVDSTKLKIRDEESMAKRVERGRDAFRKALAKAEPVEVDLLIDDRTIKEMVLLAEIMNIGLVGPNLRLAPMAEPGDGKLDIVLIPEGKRDEMLHWLEHPEIEDAPVVVETGRKVTVAEASAPLRIGDKAADESGEVTVEVREHRIVLVPPAPHEDGAAKKNGAKRK